nr:hypothetical protein [Spiractinospora alimapuensis]
MLGIPDRLTSLDQIRLDRHAPGVSEAQLQVKVQIPNRKQSRVGGMVGVGTRDGGCQAVRIWVAVDDENRGHEFLRVEG